jgi:hypothetical protein
MNSNPNFDIEKTYEKYRKFADKLAKKNEGISNLLNDLDERLVQCPASMTTNEFGCHPGGMILLSLLVSEKMISLSNALNLTEKVGLHSILMVGLFHNLGLIGNLDEDYLVPNQSSWHREKGILYTFNEDLKKSQITDRSLFILSHYGVKLSYDEWISIAISGGPHYESNRFYIGHEPELGLLVQQARTWVLGRHN